MAPDIPTRRRFVNHPGAKEAPAHTLRYEPKVDVNPVLRGLPLVVASTMYVPPTYIQLDCQIATTLARSPSPTRETGTMSIWEWCFIAKCGLHDANTT